MAGAVDNPVVIESDLLEDAAKKWHAMEPLDTIQSPLKDVDYQIYTSAGTFDPLAEEIPKSRLDDSNDYRETGMAIVQLYHHTGDALYDLVEQHDVFVLDNLGTSTWLVRLSHPSDIFAIKNDDSVRWVGSMMPGWRVSSDVDSSTDYIAAIPAVDLNPMALDVLALDLLKMGADEAWCGLHLCEIKGSVDLESLARDGRIIWSETAYEMRLTNAVAGAIVGVPEVANTTLGLDGSGEKISFTDTGIDQDHPDIVGRIAGVYTQYGLDPSPADSNGGHGTHVALTIAGDGSGDSSATGIAPGAYVVAYALEHDPTGVFGRIGSIYDMLSHAEQEGSRVAVNAWGLNGNYGAYTADSRSLDVFVHDNPDFLPVFSAGDDPNQNASKVMAPSTAKNVLSIGASTTSPSGSVANFSANGPSLDGRVKPDLVAPGVSICSGRAEEAAIPVGLSCGSGTHLNGNDMYMSLSGSSQATAVAGGSVSLIREFIREEIGISTPAASLIKAASINGAIDLGTANIPNAQEGWGQISVSNTVIPSYNGNELNTFHDNSRTLSAGFSTLYQFDIDPSSGIDITMAWTDVAGSANSAQNEARLVNDLDLLLTAPDGSVYKGNVMLNGFSVPNGVHDSLNNVERIKIAPSSSLPTGKWQLQVSHAGGLDQAFSLILTGDATIDQKADLVVFDGSIFPSSASPLVNDLITIRISWLNQGTLDAGKFRVTLEDLTTGDMIYDGNRSSLNAGVIDSLTLFHSFTTTGDHDMRLTVDVDSSILEVNDEINGLNNNIEEMTISVAALGVRLVTLDSNGAEDESMVNQTLNPSTAEGYTWPVVLKHEGTEMQSVKLHLSQVQMPNPLRDDMLLPTEDTWSRSSDLSGPFSLSAMGNLGDKIYLNITMNDDDADLSGATDRYAMAGTYVMDITAKYSNNPSVKHTIRLRLVVEEVKDVQVAPAGTSGLEAIPGGSTSFSISVRNTGNSPAVYDLDCYSENRWQVQLGQSNSSSYSFEPLDILEYLPMQVRLYVPPVADGLPPAGSTDSVTCSVTSETDPSLNISETVVLTVKTLESFETVLFDDMGAEVGPAAFANDINVDTGERLTLTLEIENTGNSVLDLTVRVNPELTTWTIQVTHGLQTENREVDVAIQPGQSGVVNFEILVSPVAVRNDENHLVIKTSQDQSNFIINETTLIVKDEIGLSITEGANFTMSTLVNGQFNFNNITVENTGNSGISIEWSHSLPPDGWGVGFANLTTYLAPRQSVEVLVGIKAPINENPSTEAFTLGVYATISNEFETMQIAESYPVEVQSGGFCAIDYDSESRSLLGVERGQSATQTLSIINIGNSPLDSNLSIQLDADDWDSKLSESSVTNLAVGEEMEIEIEVSTNDDTAAGIQELTFSCGSSIVTFEMSVKNTQEQSGLFGIVSPPVAYAIISALVLVVVIVARKIKKSAPKDLSGEELVSPDAHSIPDDGMRMQAVMDSVVGQESLASGGVTAEEIADALAKSIPSLPAPSAPVIPTGRPPSAVPAGRPPVAVPAGRPPAATPIPAPQVPAGPPLPPTGLPPGWSMEQWQHYGHQWLAQQGQQ
ncbi:MAG: S8 family serine peptidase [Candidatus Poseidoniaceae archaeon]